MQELFTNQKVIDMTSGKVSLTEAFGHNLVMKLIAVCRRYSSGMKNQLKRSLNYLSNKISSNIIDQLLHTVNSMPPSASLIELNSRVLAEISKISDEKNQSLITNFMIEGIHPSILVVKQNGRRIFLDPRDPDITIHYLLNLSWEPQVTSVFTKVFQVFKSGHPESSLRTIFVDCGANVGLHSLSAAELGYEVFAFEPDPLTFKFLHLNGTMNGLKITSKKLAVSDVEGELQFTVDSRSSGMSGLSKSESGIGRFTGEKDPDKRFSQIKVDSITLSKHFADIIHSDEAGLLCLKIDTEGAEGEVLAGAKSLIEQFDSCVIICEMHLDNQNLLKQYEKIVEVGISSGKFINMQLLKFMEEPITINHLDSGTWHQNGRGDLALFLSSRDIF